MENDPKKIRELYQNAPTAVKDVIESDATAQLMIEIGRKHSLPIDKVGNMAYVTTMMMTGVIPARAYISELEKAAGISREKASEIAEAMNSRVFAPIREELKRLHGTPSHEAFITEPAGVVRETKPKEMGMGQQKPVSVPVQRPVSPPRVNSQPAPLTTTAKAVPIIPSGIPPTVQFRSLVQKTEKGSAAPLPPQASQSAAVQKTFGHTPKIEPDREKASILRPQPSTSVKIETQPESSPKEPAPKIEAKKPEEKKSQLHEEVHRLLKEHFEATPAASPLKIEKPAGSPKEITTSVPAKTSPLVQNQSPANTPPKPTLPTYKEKDPYREPVDD